MANFYVPSPPIDDIWQGRSRWLPQLLPGALTAPFVTPRWKFNYDDAAFWVRQSRPITTLRLPAGGGYPFKPPYWKFNYDDASFWVGTPNIRIPALDEPAGGGIPFKPPYWKYNNDDPGFWVGDKSISIFGPSLPLVHRITSTLLLNLPVDYFLMGEESLFALDEDKKATPAFMVRTTNKGYE